MAFSAKSPHRRPAQPWAAQPPAGQSAADLHRHSEHSHQCQQPAASHAGNHFLCATGTSPATRQHSGAAAPPVAPRHGPTGPPALWPAGPQMAGRAIGQPFSEKTSDEPHLTSLQVAAAQGRLPHDPHDPSQAAIFLGLLQQLWRLLFQLAGLVTAARMARYAALPTSPSQAASGAGVAVTATAVQSSHPTIHHPRSWPPRDHQWRRSAPSTETGRPQRWTWCCPAAPTPAWR